MARALRAAQRGGALSPPSEALARLIGGFQVSQALSVAARLGVPDHLGEGTCRIDDLAVATEADADALYRLLRALASIGVFEEGPDRTFSLTELGEGLRSDAPDSLSGWATHIGVSSFWTAWGDLLHSIRTGENAFRHVYGRDIWSYRAEHPEESAVFDLAMQSLTRRIDESVLEAYDFGRFDTIVDIGGGNGTLLASILTRHPGARGILFDQPHVVTGAGPVLKAAGVAARCDVVGGSFFDAVPAGGDAYVLKSIIHDWDNLEATAILRVCRAAIPTDGSLLVVERELGPPNEAPAAKFGDLNMLVVPGGRERSVEEYAALFEEGGFRLRRAVPTVSGFNVLEGVPT